MGDGVQAGESELDILLSLRKFWKHILRTKAGNASANKPDATRLILSVTDRSISNKKQFSKLDIGSQLIAEQL